MPPVVTLASSSPARPSSSDSATSESFSSSSASFPVLKKQRATTTPPHESPSAAGSEIAIMATEPRGGTAIRFKLDHHPTRSGETPSIDLGPVSPVKSKAKTMARATWRITKTVVGGAFGCICYVLYKSCVLDGGSRNASASIYDDGRYNRSSHRERMYQAEVRREGYPMPRPRASTSAPSSASSAGPRRKPRPTAYARPQRLEQHR